MLISISTTIVDMELDLIDMQLLIPCHWIREKRNNFWIRYEFATKIDNRKKDILILGKGAINGLKHTLSAEKIYSIDFT